MKDNFYHIKTKNQKCRDFKVIIEIFSNKYTKLHSIKFCIFTNIFLFISLQSKYCTLVSKPERYNVPAGFSVLSEIPEATSAILENRIITALSRYQQFIDYIHISDQYSGPIQQEDANNLKQPETKPVLMVGFNLPKNGDMESVKPLLILVFYLMERLKVYRLSKEVR